MKKFSIKIKISSLKYWEERAEQYGKRAVLNIGHSEAEIQAVTQMQKDVIFPILRQKLRGDEKIILDFGCGPGRFTGDLANIIHGRAIGVDPIQCFLEMAPKNDNIEYRLMKGNNIPIDDASVDIVWICLVLGGIVDANALQSILLEIKRVLKDGGLIFLIENTSKIKDGRYWKYRTPEDYEQYFSFANLRYLSDYFDLEERISIMSGRKKEFNENSM